MKRPLTRYKFSYTIFSEEKKTKNTADCPIYLDQLLSNITGVYCSAKFVAKVYFKAKYEMQTISNLSPPRNT